MVFGRKYWLALALCLALQGSGQVSADLVVLHTNDVHCGLTSNLGYAQVAQYKKDLMRNPDDAATEAVVQREMTVVREQLQQPVATSPVDFVTDIQGQRRVRHGETNLADLAVDAIRYRLHTDVAVLNGGSFRASLPAGVVTYESLYRVFPFSNQLVVCSVTGQQLLDALEMGASRYPQEFGGFLHVSGLTYRIDPTIPSSVVLDDKGRFVKVAGPRRVKDVKVNGKNIEADEDYRVGGTAYVLRYGGDGQTSLQGGILLEDTGLSDVDALVGYLHDKGDALADYGNPAGQGRITVGP